MGGVGRGLVDASALHPTDTPTPMPIPLLGLGDSVRCGDLWEIGALYAPSLGDVLTNEPPKGEYARVDFMLTNLQDNTDYLDSYGTALSLVGVLEGRTLSLDRKSVV